jgi:creatinine amidohydrolase/Fe(II)-dependent formamide hydrolase-like protein
MTKFKLILASVLLATPSLFAQAKPSLVDFELIEIAEKLGNAIVAPVILFSPNRANPSLPGTIGISNEVFAHPVRKPGEQRDPDAKRVTNGIEGDARRSTPEIGERVSDMKVDYAVDQIQRLLK